MHNMFSSSIGQGEFLKFDKKKCKQRLSIEKNGEFLIRTKPVSAVPPQRLNQVAAAAAAAAPNSSSNESRE